MHVCVSYMHMHVRRYQTFTDCIHTQYDSVVGPNGQFYDTGVELTAEGLYGRHDYLKHVTRGTLSLHSLYLILWSNFASFSLALLTQPKAEANLAGKILSNSEPAREYCVAQMKKLWVLLRNGLGVSDEERLLLVKSCLNNLLEVQVSTGDMCMCMYVHVEMRSCSILK